MAWWVWQLGENYGPGFIVLAVLAVSVVSGLMLLPGAPPPHDAAERTPIASATPDNDVTHITVAIPGRRPQNRYSTAELCAAVRRSYLAEPSDPAALAQWISDMRGYLFDEIERRDPAGFARWLATAPQVGSDPTYFLTPGC